MITELSIHGYRCFPQFSMSDIGRVNLLVGKNNSGKTALLEAIELISSGDDPWRRLIMPLHRRGEGFPEDDSRQQRSEYDINHFFHGHRADIGSMFKIEGSGSGTPLDLRAEIVSLTREELPLEGLHEDDIGESFGSAGAALQLSSGVWTEKQDIPLTSRGGVNLRLRPPQIIRDEGGGLTTFVAPDSLSAYVISKYWNSIALTVDEALVIRALRILDKDIQRIAFSATERPRYFNPAGRGGVRVKLRGAKLPVPLGSLGDGMWRMLCIVICLIRAKGSILLIDEIDTGLHYSVMEEMWDMVLSAAARFNVQVFATTHSSDCVASLANVCQRVQPETVSVQRIEAEKPMAVAYSEEEIWTAARHGIEMR